MNFALSLVDGKMRGVQPSLGIDPAGTALVRDVSEGTAAPIARPRPSRSDHPNSSGDEDAVTTRRGRERQPRHGSRAREREGHDDHRRGGKVYGRWPGLAPEQRYDGRDLAVTTDFRSVFTDAVRGHLGVTDTATIFPGFKSSAPLGFLA